MATYKFHELCEAFPLLEDQQLKELADDIKTNGQRQPIILLDGKILDGRNRYLACKKARVEPQFKNFRGDPASLVKSLNIHRRHLNESQRAMLAADLATLTHGQHPNGEGAYTNEEAAKATNVSTGSVKRARKVKARGSEKLQKAVRKGRVKVSAGAHLARLPKPEQEKILKRGAKAVKEKAREFRGEPRGGLAAEQKQMKEWFAVAKKKMLDAFDKWSKDVQKQIEEAGDTPEVNTVLDRVRDLIAETLTA